jgi:predicted HicB family RNase H-like nuclease
LEYKGYIGVIEYDDDAEIFHGEVINLRDVITFQGESVHELRQALRDSVDEYVEFCRERGEDPEKPFSGNISLRLSPELHRKIFVRAKRERASVNRLITDTLEKAFA